MKLCVTYCAKNKWEGTLPPDALYVSQRIHRFASHCKAERLNWAILSAKYGLFFPEESRDEYNVTFKSNPACWLGVQMLVDGKGLPQTESDRILAELAKTVKATIEERFIDKIVYYYEKRGPFQPPKGYLALLHFAMDGCSQVHTWPELLDCVGKHGKINVTTQLDFT